MELVNTYNNGWHLLKQLIPFYNLYYIIGFIVSIIRYVSGAEPKGVEGA